MPYVGRQNATGKLGAYESPDIHLRSAALCRGKDARCCVATGDCRRSRTRIYMQSK